MRNMLEVIVKELVDNPQQVRVEELRQASGVTFQITVADQDIGKVIGKDGRIVNALRAIASGVGDKEGRPVYVEVSP